MAKENQKKNSDDKPKAFEFVLVKDEKGEFKYYYKGNFYTLDQIKKFLSPKEIEKLEQKEAAAEKKESASAKATTDKQVDKEKEVPQEKKELENKMLEQMARKIIDEINLPLSASDKEKLIKIIISGLRRIRKDLEIIYILTAAISAGGLGFDELKAEKVIQAIKEALTEVEKKRLQIIRGEFQLEKAQPKVVPLQAPAQPQTQIARKSLSGLDEKKEVMADVKFGPQLMGPIEELRTMDLVNLRRLGTNQEEIVSELLERVDLLAEESMQQKIDGIKAWQKSPVYQKYLNIGYKSISENKPVENIIADQAAKGEKVMSFEEFQAIMEANSQLQY